jgi:hypothetical protein
VEGGLECGGGLEEYCTRMSSPWVRLEPEYPAGQYSHEEKSYMNDPRVLLSGK